MVIDYSPSIDYTYIESHTSLYPAVPSYFSLVLLLVLNLYRLFQRCKQTIVSASGFCAYFSIKYFLSATCIQLPCIKEILWSFIKLLFSLHYQRYASLFTLAWLNIILCSLIILNYSWFRIYLPYIFLLNPLSLLLQMLLILSMLLIKLIMFILLHLLLHLLQHLLHPANPASADTAAAAAKALGSC